MSEQPRTVSVRLLDKEYMISCPDGSEAELLASADYLNEKLRDIRKAGKVLGLERIAVMAALNISHELMQLKQSNRTQVEARISELGKKIDRTLQQSNKNPTKEQE